MKALLRDLVPPIAVKAVRRLRHRPAFSGDFGTFGEAAAASSGYDSPAIARAAQPDEPGISVTDRDQQILAALSIVAGSRILDVGGAGGHYCRLIKRFRPDAVCTVLETPAMVSAHRSTDWLTFTDSTAALSDRFDLVLLSGVLQYVPEPLRMLDEVASLGRFTLINRHPFDRDRITVQRVETPYRASYPARFFAREPFMRHVERTHEVVMRWLVPQDAPLVDGKRIVYEGMLLKRLAPPG
jgi:putative methyltransferase (TIGR04325 family)